MQYYGFTIKNTHSNCIPIYQDYEDWIDNAKKYGFDVQMVGYELDQQGRLHMHGVALATHRLTFKRLMYRKFHQHIDALPSNNDLMRWSDYCKKDFDKRYDTEEHVITKWLQSDYNFI